MNSASSYRLACLSPADWESFDSGGLNPEQLAQLSEHLSHCGDCRHLAQQRGVSTIGFSGTPLAGLASTCEHESSVRGESATPAPQPAPAGRPLAERYVLGEEIARGGMGVVNRARDLLFQREVAIKRLVPRWEREPDERRRRQLQEQAREMFRYEAEITAKLQHPGVPPVHDMGQAGDGLPFLAMKLIQGETLQTLLERRTPGQIDLTRWLPVLEQVAQAIGFAHSQNILHRDLKPQNIMVGEFGEVQVMDWGLAKVIGAPERPAWEANELDERQFVSRQGDVKGTLRYMAPEQARGEVDRLDPRADVFGLGAILCQILIGEPPYSAGTEADLRRAAAAGDLAQASARIRECGADQEVIDLALRSLALQVSDRPASGTAVAQAIASHRQRVEDRLRASETDRALAVQRLVEQARRRKLWYAIAAALLLFTLASSSLAIVYARSNSIIADREHKAQSAATLARLRETQAQAASALAASREQTAKEESAVSTAVSSFLEYDLLALAGAEEQLAAGLRADPNLKVRDLVLRAAARIEGKFSAQPAVEARVRNMLGRSLAGVGEPQQAVKQFAKAYELYQATFGPESTLSLAALGNLAGAYCVAGDLEQALPLAEEAVARRRKALGAEHPHTLEAMGNLGLIYQDVGQFDKSRTLLEDALRTQRRVLGPEEPHTLVTFDSLAKAYARTGQIEQALPMFEEVLKLRTKVLGPEHAHTLDSMNGLVICLRHARQLDRAEELGAEALKLRRKVLGPEHPDTLDSLLNLANVHYSSGDASGALPLFEETLHLKRKVLGEDHPDSINALNNLGHACCSAGEIERGLALLEEVPQRLTKALGERHPQTLLSRLGLAQEQVEAKHFETAEKNIRSVWDRVTDLPPPSKHHVSLAAIKLFFQLYKAWDKTDEASQWEREWNRLQPASAKP